MIKDSLENSGFTEMQSETLSHILNHLATKDDLRILHTQLHTEIRSEIGSLRSELHDEIGSLRSELRTEIGSLRSELRSELRTEIGSLRSELSVQIERSSGAVKDTIIELQKTILGLQNRLFMVALGLIGALATVFTLLDVFID